MSARPLHILYVAPFGLRHKTTVWARILPLARQLVQRGVRGGARCTILVPPWDSPEDSGLAQNLNGVEVVQVNLQGGLPAITVRLMREIALRRPDIVHCVKPRAYAGIVQWLLWQRRRLGKATPRLFLDLDDWEQAWQPVNHYPPPAAAFLAWQEEWGIRHADAITVASRWLEARARAYAPHTPILYLPNGVEMPDREVGASDTSHASDRTTAVMSHRQMSRRAEVGRGSPTYEDLPFSIRSRLTSHVSLLWFTRFVEVEPAWFAEFASALFAANPEVRLIIAGSPLHSGGDLAFRSALPAEYADRVSWLGFVPPETLPALHAASTVAIFPAEESVLQMAKCSVRLATTLLAGVPVVASAVGEQAYFGADGSALLLPADATPHAFAAQVIRLLADPIRQQTIIASARSHLAANYQWSMLAESLHNFYQ